MVPRILLALLAYVLVLLPASPARAQSDSAACAGTFRSEAVDTVGAVGVQSSIAVDSQGRARIAYRNAAGSQIRYAHEEGDGWVVEVLPQRGFFHGLSLALNPDGIPYIGYGVQEETPIGIVVSATVAHRDGDRWTAERIEGALPGEVAIGFDPAGTLHAVYFSFIPAFVIRYATLTPDGWSIETVFGTGGLPAGRFSLAFDPEGRPHVTAQVSQVLLHMVRTDAGWAVDRQLQGEGATIAIDAAGVPHVATHVRVPPSVQYRSRRNGVWTVETVDTVDAGPSRAVSLAIDRFDRPVLAYWDAAAGLLKLAWRDRGSWNVRALGAGGTGEGPSLALAQGTAPRVSSMDPAQFDLTLVSGAIPPPNRAPHADAGGPYQGTVGQSIAFDGAGSADPDGDVLTYAWDFGDGRTAQEPTPQHVYAAPATYPVCLFVRDRGCPSLGDSARTHASVVALLATRVFRAEDRKIELVDDRGRQSFRVEPVNDDFRLDDLDPGTLTATFGTGTAAPIRDRSLVISDSDGNGVPDLQVTFLTSSLSALLADAPTGKSRVTLGLEGKLRSGARVRGEVSCEVQKHRDCRAGCAEVSPNPLRPGASIRFTTTRPGRVEVEIFDPQGRLLGDLLPSAFLGAGVHEQRIEARDPAGRPLASGVYFYRVRTDEGLIEGRFSILK